MLENEEVLKKDSSVAKVFSSSFSNIIKALVGIPFFLITLEEILKEIGNLDISKSTQNEDVSTKSQ